MAAKRCKAKSKTTGEQCRQPAVTGKEVCRYHGGRTPQGKASPNYKHGRYTKFLPDRLKKRYETTLNDETLLELKDDVSITTIRVQEALSDLNSDTPQELWFELNDVLISIKSAKTPVALKKSLAELERVIKAGCNSARAWEQVGRVVKERISAVSAEHRRLQELDGFVSVEQAMQLVTTIYQKFMDLVQDKKLKMQIVLELQKILGDDGAEVLGDVKEFDESDIPEVGSEPASTPNDPNDPTPAPASTPNTPIETFSDGAGV